jgi:hypothetical protein
MNVEHLLKRCTRAKRSGDTKLGSFHHWRVDFSLCDSAYKSKCFHTLIEH